MLTLPEIQSPVRLKHSLMHANGAVIRQGTILHVLRAYTVNRQTADRLTLGYADGRIVLPIVDPADVEPVSGP